MLWPDDVSSLRADAINDQVNGYIRRIPAIQGEIGAMLQVAQGRRETGRLATGANHSFLGAMHCCHRYIVLRLTYTEVTSERQTTQLLLERFARAEGNMSDQQLVKELKVRNILAERIAAVFQQRQKIGAERRTRECEYQRLNNDRALARHYRLRGRALAYAADGIREQPKSAPRAVRDSHVSKVAEDALQPYVVFFRWNSVNGSTV